MKKFNLKTVYTPSGDQPKAIENLIAGLHENKKHQVLLGATGTGKTFTIANVINKIQKPTLVIVSNKTLAMQLYVEFQELFPENKVEYYVSHFDFYQPEAYVSAKDLYISKDARRNTDLDMMRISSLNSLITRKDTIVVASVASIYPTQNPDSYSKFFVQLNINQVIKIKDLLISLIEMGYVRNDFDNEIGSFSLKGDTLTIRPGWTDSRNYRVDFFGDVIENISVANPINNNVFERLKSLTIYPASAYVADKDKMKIVVSKIKKELEERVKYFKENKLFIEADRLEKRTNYDLEMLEEFGVCSGIENYSMYLDFRTPGSTPWTIIDYFGNDFLTIIDESHLTIPQIRGMFNTDRSRKESLVEYGFRLPTAKENRPLNFDEFQSKLDNTIYISATPSEYELGLANNEYAEQIIRPTGLLDPIIEVRKSENQIEDIINEIVDRTKKQEKVFITTLTIKSSEKITDYLQERNIKVAFLHSELKTFERTDILNDLRLGVYDVIVGVNLLREGLDIPEVSLVCILDADKNGFLRNTRSLIQTIGRAARNENGKVIMYADEISTSMQEAIDETSRRRSKQEEYNKKNGITPKTIIKKINKTESHYLKDVMIKNKKLKDKSNIIIELKEKMFKAAKDMNFEEAARLRDIIFELEVESNGR